MEKEIIGNAILYRADCRDVLPILPQVDAVVTDPPYGIGEARGRNKSRGGKKAPARDYGNKAWDDSQVDAETMRAVIAKGRYAIIFGGNFYAMPPSSCWLVWDKQNTGDFADCELAWTNLPGAVRLIRFLWNGMLRANREPRGDHPTQKPLGVMSWCLRRLPENCRIILDPFMGSGTTGVAAIGMDKIFIGVEKEAEYFDRACQRIKAAQAQGKLLPPPTSSIAARQLLIDLHSKAGA